MRQMFARFKQFVAEKNIPECKKFIDNYVEKVLGYQDHLEVRLKVAFPFKSKDIGYSFQASVNMTSLFKTYRKVVGL